MSQGMVLSVFKGWAEDTSSLRHLRFLSVVSVPSCSRIYLVRGNGPRRDWILRVLPIANHILFYGI